MGLLARGAPVAQQGAATGGRRLGSALLLVGAATVCAAQSPEPSPTLAPTDPAAAELPLIPVAALPAPAPAPPAGEASPVALAPVYVTASRNRSDLERTPISVSVTADQTLRQTDITDVEALSARLPNAQLALTPTNSFLFVRGLGTGSVRSAEQSVGFFVDGVFLGRPQVALFDFLDIRQVELLRGPQGALLGKNTVAGAVNVQTAPVSWQPEGYLEAMSGAYGSRRIRGAYSDALGETLAVRVAYSEVAEDGTLFNTTQQRQDLARPGRAGRLKLRWQPDAKTGLGLALQSARLRQTGDSFELSQASDQTLALYRLFDPQTSSDIGDRRTHTDHRGAGAEIEGEDLSLTLDSALGDGELLLVASQSQQDSLADLDLDVSPVPLLNLPSVEGYRQRSAELRYRAPLDWGQYTLGVAYFEADLDLQVDIRLFEDGVDRFAAPLAGGLPALPAGGLGSLLALVDAIPGAGGVGFGQSRHRLLQGQRTASAFGALRWDLGRRWQLQADGRLTRETKDGDQSIAFSGLSGPLLGRILGEEEYQLQARRRETDFSPRLSALFEISPRLTSYLTLAQGFKSGGFNNLAAVPERAEFDAERSLTVETGIRLKPRRGLRGALQLFRTDFENLQVAALDGTEFFVGNAARAHTQGLELSLASLLPYGLALSTELGYLDARYDRYENAPAQAGSDEDSQDLSGRVLQRAPRFSGSVQLDWRFALPWLGLPAAAGAVAEGASRQFLNIDLDPIDAQPGTLRYNAYAALSDRRQRLSLRLIGRNLTDRVVRREAADVAVVGAHSVGLFPPRTLALELGYRFD